MQYLSRELALMQFVLKVKPSKQEPGKMELQTFVEVDKMKNAIGIEDKLMPHTKDEDGRKFFVDADIDLSTSEKSFLLELLKREWGIDDARTYLALKEKLEK